ncbi:MAG TPA: gliding motility-associated C-terminal domain-containing protein, partial [Paludibacter sp.]|nr:gliding motility-associated C-terminal domain-containing protein [Paludibacter sp.]
MLIFLSIMTTVSAQQIGITSGKGKIYDQYAGIDYLVMMYDINAAAEISVTLPASTLTVKWYRYPDNLEISNQNFINPDDHTGYLLKIEGTLNGQAYYKELSIWVIDYKLYEPTLTALEFPDPASTGCKQMSLTLEGQIPAMFYKAPNQQQYSIDREFNLQYESLEFEDGEWRDLSVEMPVLITDNIVEISESPLKDTYFALKGDQFAEDLGLEPYEIQSSLYQAIRVSAHIKTETEVRTEKNEGDRPEDITVLSGSAPLDINFTSLSNEPVANYFRWEISADGQEPFIIRTGLSHKYSFKEAGTFTVKLIASNNYCTDMDSVVVKVSESAVYAPNVFTPNGDGINDEFRVAYKSIVEFNCWVFNRWGQEVYHWTDPQKGWDGTVKGKPASEGAYFYVIRAKGADGIEYK